MNEVVNACSGIMNEETLRVVKDFVKYIKEQVQEGVNQEYVKEDKFCSADIKQLSEALSKAQAEHKRAYFNKKEAYLGTQYADLNTLQEATRESLAKNNLSVIFFVELADGKTVLHTRLLHASGEWIESRARIVSKDDDVDSFESSLCMHKRLAFMALTGITPVADEGDDGGEKVMATTNKRVVLATNKRGSVTSDVISKDNLRRLEEALEGFTPLAMAILDKYHINTLADLPNSVFTEVWNRVHETIKTYK